MRRDGLPRIVANAAFPDQVRCVPELSGSVREDDRVASDRVGDRVCLGIPGEIVEIVDVDNDIAKVSVGGVTRNVNIGLLRGTETVAVGDWVLIHVGFALSKIDSDEATATLAFLESLGEEYTRELDDLRASDIS